MTSLESKFDADMYNIYVTAKKELGYNASRFMQLVARISTEPMSKSRGSHEFI